LGTFGEFWNFSGGPNLGTRGFLPQWLQTPGVSHTGDIRTLVFDTTFFSDKGGTPYI